MKYCSKCGAEMMDEAVICIKCGCATENTRVTQDSGLTIAAKIFMILSTVASAIYLIPLAWCIPMTVSYFNKVKKGQPVSMAFKVCTLLFVNLIAGIIMLCDKDH